MSEPELPLILTDPEQYRRRLNAVAAKAGEGLSRIAQRMGENVTDALRGLQDTINRAILLAKPTTPQGKWRLKRHILRHWAWEDAGYPGWTGDGRPPRIRRDAFTIYELED